MKTLAFPIIVGLTILAFIGCVSAAPPKDPSGIDISVSRLTRSEVLQTFGSSPDQPNPYRMPGGLLMGYPHEFVVLKIAINAISQTDIMVDQIAAIGTDGKPVARYYDLPEFCDYLSGWASLSKILPQNLEIAKDTYLPGPDFQTRKGQRTYYAVLIGKNPLPRPFTIKVSLGFNNAPERQFSIDVTR